MMPTPKIPTLVMTTLNHISYTDGHYDYDNGGVWVDGTMVEKPFQGALLPLSYEDLKYDKGGTYTSEDQKLYTYTAFQKGEKIVDNGIEYAVAQDKNHNRYGGGLHIYILKRGDNQ